MDDEHHELWRTLRWPGKQSDTAADVDTVMQRYRPIAPKVTTGQPCVAPNKSFSGTSRTKRTKRKYVRVSRNTKNMCRQKGNTSQPADPKNIVTLQLLPEKSPVRIFGKPSSSDPDDESKPRISENPNPTMEAFNKDTSLVIDRWFFRPGSGVTEAKRRVETWVSVESVTGACDDSCSSSHPLGYTDVEIADWLDKDTCPGFISDSLNRVKWINEAYRRTICGKGCGRESPEVVVWLVSTDEAKSFREYQSFTCKARMQYTWQETRYTKTVPCDAWKMDLGGFAWRLDTRAALTLCDFN